MPAASSVLCVLVGIAASLAAYVYFFGIPPAIKRELEQKALQTLGENKASYLVKDQINRLPASDQKDAKAARQSLAKLVGGAVNNPFGKLAGEAADDATRPFTGR